MSCRCICFFFFFFFSSRRRHTRCLSDWSSDVCSSDLASAFTMATMGRTAGKFDARLSILAGVAIFALSMWKHAHFTTDSGMSDFFWPLIFRGVGLGLIFVPLTNLALADLPMSKIPNGTWLFNLLRQLGGSVGIAISATLVQRFTAIHRADLIANVTAFSEVTRERLA